MRVLRFENEAEDLLHYLKDTGLDPGLEGTLARAGDDEVVVEADGDDARGHAQRGRDGLGRGRPVAAAAHRAAGPARARPRALRPVSARVSDQADGLRRAAERRSRLSPHGRRSPGRAAGRRRRAARRARRAAADEEPIARRGRRRARRRGGARAGRHGGAALLRVRRRRRRSPSATARRHARHRLGPDGVQRGQLAGRGAVEAVVGGLAQGPARPAGDGVGRLRHRRAGGEHRRSRGRAAPRAGRRRLGRRARRAGRRAAGARARRRGAARDDRPVAAAARPGRRRASRPVGADANGAIDRRAWPPRSRTTADRPTIVCAAGGQRQHRRLRRPARAIAAARSEHGAWVHVDGAFGLWAAAQPGARGTCRRCRAAPIRGARDGHKWLNVPYDCGLRVLRRPRRARRRRWPTPPRTWSARDATRPRPTGRSSRPAGPAGFAVWAALRELGAAGVADLVDRCCALARRSPSGWPARRRRDRQRRRAEPGARRASARDERDRR